MTMSSDERKLARITGVLLLVLFGAIDQGSEWQGIATIPEFFWELSLGIYLTAKGFKADSPILDGNPATATRA